jgi:hypothetical protein
MEASLEQYQELIDKIRKEAPEYQEYFISPNGKLSCLAPFIYTWAILEDLSDIGYENRWCYGSLLEAMLAKQDWLEEKSFEPTDYIRRLLCNKSH